MKKIHTEYITNYYFDHITAFPRQHDRLLKRAFDRQSYSCAYKPRGVIISYHLKVL